MNTELLFYTSILVFALMITGLFLTIREFLEVSEDPSQKKGVDPNGNGDQDGKREKQER
jgi:hypothetical protein